MKNKILMVVIALWVLINSLYWLDEMYVDLPKLFSIIQLSDSEKRVAAQQDISFYNALLDVSNNTSENAKVTIFTSNCDYYYFKTNYYLYPRTISCYIGEYNPEIFKPESSDSLNNYLILSIDNQYNNESYKQIYENDSYKIVQQQL